MGAGAQLITYHASGPAYAWRAVVEHNLVQRGWVNPAWWHPGLPDLSYTYRSEFELGAIWHQADLRGEPNVAQIYVRRWIEPPWWWYLPWRITSDDRSADQSSRSGVERGS